MKTMKKFLSMAALAMVGAMTTGCSNEDDSIIDTTQQPEVIKSNVVTMTTTVGLDGGVATRALTSTGAKTFAKDDKIAVVYETSTGTAKVESAPITTENISADGKSATFTVTLTDAKASGTVKYIYPAAMAGETDVDYTKLNSQDGTLASLASNLDLAVFDGYLTAEAKLPASASLENKLAILALTIKDNEATPNDLTSSITSLSVGDGTNTYSVTRSAAAGPIYVAIQPTTSATIGVNATVGTAHYYKELTSKTYAADNGYSVTWKMAQGAHLSAIAADFTANNGDVLTGTPASNVKISIADGANVTLKNVNITNLGNNCDWAGINCLGDATLMLEGTNEVCAGKNGSGYSMYPGIYIAPDKTLTIQGDGTLTAYSGPNSFGVRGAGIGGGNNIACGNIVINSGNITATGGYYAAGIGGYGSCGTITINGGTVTATSSSGGAGIGGGVRGTCGDITISGGTVTATGGSSAAGIGSGWQGNCGNITITSGVTYVTATMGSGATNSIGAGDGGTCGTVKIEDASKVTQN